jgi:hypothetical protein
MGFRSPRSVIDNGHKQKYGETEENADIVNRGALFEGWWIIKRLILKPLINSVFENQSLHWIDEFTAMMSRGLNDSHASDDQQMRML